MASRPPLPRLRILVAEDNAVNRKVLGGLLATRSDAGAHDVIFAETGRAALDLAATQDFDLILTDLHMPEMDGIAATRAIRALPPPHGKVKIKRNGVAHVLYFSLVLPISRPVFA